MPVNPFDPTGAAAMTTGSPAKNEPPKKAKKVPVPDLAAMPDLLKNRPIILPPKKAAVDTSNGFPAPNDPYWKTHPLVTEHKDGTVRVWGEDTTRNPNVLPKQMLPPPTKKDVSDKQKGYSNNYYTPNH